MDSKDFFGIPVIPMRELDRDDPSVFACVAYMHYDFYDCDLIPPKMKGRFVHYDSIFIFDKTAGGNYLDYSYFSENRGETVRKPNLI